jgi:hypothetical protein
VLHEVRADVYLVTHTDADGGCIARVSPDGRVQDVRWIGGAAAGLRSPSGMAIRGDTLFVADGDCVRLFHRVTGSAAGAVCPAGAQALVAVAVDDAGMLYIGAAGAGEAAVALHTLDPAGTLSPVAASAGLVQPRGVAAGPRGVFVTSAGHDHVYHMTGAGPRALLQGEPKELRGIVTLPDGSFAFSNATDSTVLFVEANPRHGRGFLWTLARGLASPGQPGYDAVRRRVLIPETGRHRLHFIPVVLPTDAPCPAALAPVVW